MSKPPSLPSDWKRSAAKVLGEDLVRWYRAHARDLPWRRTTDIYAIWVSEIMLQQTQVKTVLPYYEKFLVRFPTPADLAAASEQDLLAAWQGLGYYRRIRNLQSGVRSVLAAGWPTSSREWLTLPGIGQYTAAALASIGLGERIAVVDGNVERVYSRVAGDPSLSLNSSARLWAQGVMDSTKADPGEINQALMELGATVCTPRNPVCPNCPILHGCIAARENRTASLPTRVPPRETVAIERYGMAYIDQDRIALIQIPENEWWAGLWTLPWTDSPIEPSQYVGQVRHTVTHHRITFSLFVVDAPPTGAELYPFTALPPLPSMQRKAIELVVKSHRSTPRLSFK